MIYQNGYVIFISIYLVPFNYTYIQCVAKLLTIPKSNWKYNNKDFGWIFNFVADNSTTVCQAVVQYWYSGIEKRKKIL